MKISAIENTQIQNNRKPQSFGGLNLVTFWNGVDKFGRTGQFLVEDIGGAGLPRSIQGAVLGREEGEKINFLGFLQEAIREVLTGPLMCIGPALVIALAKKSGKTANAHVENIKNLSYLMENFTKENGASFASKEELQNAFYTNVAQDMLKSSIGKEEVGQSDVEEIVKYIKQYGAADKKDAGNVLKDAQLAFEKIVKANKETYENTDFLAAKYSLDATNKGSVGFKTYLGYINSYIQDFTKKFGTDVTKENVKNFKNTWVGRRVLIIVSSIVFTGIIMSFIPKLYTKLTGSVNPNAKAVYAKANANKNNGKEEDK